MPVICSPCIHISYAPPAIVVLAVRPTTERSIKGEVLAMTKAIAAATVSASGRSRGPAGRLASGQPHRAQRALPPGASGGIRCSKSQSGQATDNDIRRRFKAELRCYTSGLLAVYGF